VEDSQKLSRRRFLRVSAITAATTVIAACGGTAATTPTTAPATGGEATTAPAAEATTAPAAEATVAPAAEATVAPAAGGEATAVPATAPGSYKDAPSLQGQNLPPVAERLPKNPLVIAHAWLGAGKYGGVLRNSADNWGTTGTIQESMYGNSFLRYLKDGLEIGPGLAESWESNDDASEWTFKFREGLKWSDGQPWTTKDIMFWWEDQVLFKNADNADLSSDQQPPDEARSGKGTVMTLEAPDDYTIVMKFDAPAPLTADRIAMWVNRGIGPRWHDPRHYLEQFHPKYNTAVTDFKEFNEKREMRTNPDNPTMTGWRLKTYEEGVRAVWERNPYYWCVDQEGNQLPYIDAINVTTVQNAEAQKLDFISGKVDWSSFNGLTLADVSAIKEAGAQSKLQVELWDSGSGTGSIFFLNYDYKEEPIRKIFRDPKFRKALSHAYNRTQVQKVIYYGTGELTSGTMSPKAIEYQFNDEAKQRYAEFRDYVIKYDPEMAKSMLDELGMKVGADGFRTLPDGGALRLRLEFPADTGQEHQKKNEILAENLKAVGINAVPNPVTPTAFADQWKAGELMSHTAWEVGDGPNHLVFPSWMVPIENERWAPLHGTYYSLLGTEKAGTEEDVDPWERNPPRVAAEKGGPVEKLYQIYEQTKVETDVMKRHQQVWEIVKLHVADGPYFIGCVANYPRINLFSSDLKNWPKRADLAQGGFQNPWIHPVPAVYDPETWYFENPESHT
jgi:peptide/nickel transport system substrate-binding protein